MREREREEREEGRSLHVNLADWGRPIHNFLSLTVLFLNFQDR